MKVIPATQARQQWAATLASAAKRPLTITQHGRPAITVMDADLAVRALQALQDAEDAAEADRARAEVEAGQPTVSLEELARELGLEIA